jgi:hypothetical protein
MKKVMFLAMMFIFVCNALFAQTVKGKGQTPTESALTIRLGNPNQDCNGGGLCGISLESKAGIPVTAKVVTEKGTQKLVLQVNKQQAFADEKGRAAFSGKSFTMEENYRLPEVVCQQLKLKSGTQLQKGVYPISPSGGGDAIWFILIIIIK